MLSGQWRKELLEYSFFQKPSRRLKLPQSIHYILSNLRHIALKSLKKRKLAAYWETPQTWHHVSWRLTSLAVSMLVNDMHPGPFSGTEVNWHETSSIHTTKLSWSPKTYAKCSWAQSLARGSFQSSPRSCLGECSLVLASAMPGFFEKLEKRCQQWCPWHHLMFQRKCSQQDCRWIVGAFATATRWKAWFF